MSLAAARTRAAVNRDGRILALELEIAEDFGAYCFYPANYMARVAAMRIALVKNERAIEWTGGCQCGVGVGECPGVGEGDGEVPGLGLGDALGFGVGEGFGVGGGMILKVGIGTETPPVAGVWPPVGTMT